MGHEGYITVGLFEDNTPGEVFITMAKQGSTIGGLMDTIATLISLNLQYGVPLDAIVRKFEHMRFEPAGMTTNSDIPFAKSFVDYIVRWMGMQFSPGYREANAPKRESAAPEVETNLPRAIDSRPPIASQHHPRWKMATGVAARRSWIVERRSVTPSRGMEAPLFRLPPPCALPTAMAAAIQGRQR